MSLPQILFGIYSLVIILHLIGQFIYRAWNNGDLDDVLWRFILSFIWPFFTAWFSIRAIRWVWDGVAKSLIK